VFIPVRNKTELHKAIITRESAQQTLAPWYKLGLQYVDSEGARINDHHLKLAEKRVARDA
jgi:hypothetical protein